MIHKCLCVYCLLLHYKFQSVPSGKPLDLTAQNIDPTNKNPSIYYCGRYLDLPTACLHINTPYDCAIHGRGAEVPNHHCHCPGFRRGDISCDSAEEGGWKNCRDLSLSLLHFTFDYCVVRVWGEMGSRLRSWADCDNADPGTTLGTTITHFTPPGPGVAQCQQ